MINSKLSKIKTGAELMPLQTPLAKELVYSMKVNYWLHEDPQRIRISRLTPMFKGTRERVFGKANRPILEMWLEEDCLSGEVLEDPAKGLDSSLPTLVRIGRGKTAQ